MQYIKFNEIPFTVLFSPNISASRFQVSIAKDDYTLDEILSEVSQSESITMLEDEEVTGIYNGYNNLIAVSVYPSGESYTVNIELENSDIQAQIDALTQTVNNVQQVQEQQASAIEELTPYTDTKTAYYGETSKTFYGVPEGNVTVFFDNYNGAYTTSREEDRLTVSFDTLEAETNITISIQ